MLRDEQDAEDATVEVFRRVLVGLKQRPKGDKERVWFFQIVRRVGFRAGSGAAQRRKRTADREIDDLESIPWHDPVSKRVLDHGYVASLMDQLPERQREAVWLCVGLEYTSEETAQILHVPTNTVKSWVMRALVRMRQRAATESCQGSLIP